jgi:hypothetical protein
LIVGGNIEGGAAIAGVGAGIMGLNAGAGSVICLFTIFAFCSTSDAEVVISAYAAEAKPVPNAILINNAVVFMTHLQSMMIT